MQPNRGEQQQTGRFVLRMIKLIGWLTPEHTAHLFCEKPSIKGRETYNHEYAHFKKHWNRGNFGQFKMASVDNLNKRAYHIYYPTDKPFERKSPWTFRHNFALLDSLVAFTYYSMKNNLLIDVLDEPRVDLKDSKKIFKPDAFLRLTNENDKEFDFLVEMEAKNPGQIIDEKLPQILSMKNTLHKERKNETLNKKYKILFVIMHKRPERYSPFLRPIAITEKMKEMEKRRMYGVIDKMKEHIPKDLQNKFLFKTHATLYDTPIIHSWTNLKKQKESLF